MTQNRPVAPNDGASTSNIELRGAIPDCMVAIRMHLQIDAARELAATLNKLADTAEQS